MASAAVLFGAGLLVPISPAPFGIVTASVTLVEDIRGVVSITIPVASVASESGALRARIVDTSVISSLDGATEDLTVEINLG